MGKKYQTKSGFIKRTIAGETLLVPVGATTMEFNGMIMLNETADFLWTELQDPKTVDEMVTAMEAEFDASSDDIKKDVMDYITHGLSEGLILEITD